MKLPTLSLLALFLGLVTNVARADVAPKQDEMGRDYFLYLPQKVDPKKTYWLVVGVHGYGGDGRGAAGLAGWVKKGDCIVVGPSFPNEGYQLLEKQAGEQLVKLFDLLKTQYKLHPKLFVHGFSGGAQFAHRFLMKHPDLVAGCSAHSGGSWATGEQWMSINPDAAGVPLVISCGEKDTGLMAAGVPHGRLDWARRFEKQALEAGLSVEAKYWPGVPHAQAPGVMAMAEECYRVATKVLPKIDEAVSKATDAKTANVTAIAAARNLLARPTTELMRRLFVQRAKLLPPVEAPTTRKSAS